jgi:hypothetical protein
LPCGSVQPRTGLIPRIFGRLTTPEADDCHLEKGSDLDGLGRNLLAMGRVGLQSEATAHLAVNRADLLGGRLLALGDVEGRAGIAAKSAQRRGMGEAGEPGRFIEPEVDDFPLAAAEASAISAPASGTGERGHAPGQSSLWRMGLAQGRQVLDRFDVLERT